jgi:transcriptional regulator with GAF, ATPase, and Fis domain
MEELRVQIELVASARSTVLVTGETGTGKGLVARTIHECSRRRNSPFVHVDCAALSPSVIESELFGHERGAFTGANERRRGRFELAEEGTLFLDELAETEPHIQAKLLRALQDRRIERVGGTETVSVRARIIAATNRDLAVEMANGRFRPDLFYRLQVFELRLPPLRDRISDVPLLVRSALEELGASQSDATEAFYGRLLEHSWPGNVRELRNLVERLLIFKPRGTWSVADLQRVAFQPISVLAAQLEGDPRDAKMRSSDPESRGLFEERERMRLSQALSRHRWNVSAAARSLGLSRGALRGRMSRLGLR